MCGEPSPRGAERSAEHARQRIVATNLGRKCVTIHWHGHGDTVSRRRELLPSCVREPTGFRAPSTEWEIVPVTPTSGSSLSWSRQFERSDDVPFHNSPAFQADSAGANPVASTTFPLRRSPIYGAGRPVPMGRSRGTLCDPSGRSTQVRCRGYTMFPPRCRYWFVSGSVIVRLGARRQSACGSPRSVAGCHQKTRVAATGK